MNVHVGTHLKTCEMFRCRMCWQERTTISEIKDHLRNGVPYFIPPPQISFCVWEKAVNRDHFTLSYACNAQGQPTFPSASGGLVGHQPCQMLVLQPAPWRVWPVEQRCTGAGPWLPVRAVLGGADVPGGDQLHGPEGAAQGPWLGGVGTSNAVENPVCYFLFLGSVSFILLQLITYPGCPRGMQKCGKVPDYGGGTGGWRSELAQAGNSRARHGVQAPGSFYAWLLGRAKMVHPALLLCELPAVAD
jgi:hypothetical protein